LLSLSTILLSGCFLTDGGNTETPLQQAENLNNAEQTLWETKAIQHYAYSLSHDEVLNETTFNGPCEITSDTSWCNLTSNDGENDKEYPSPNISQYFADIDSQFSYLNTLIRLNDSTSNNNDSIKFIHTDTSMTYAVFFKDTSGYGIGLGFSVVYNSAFGYPQTLIIAPFGPIYTISNFSIISGN